MILFSQESEYTCRELSMRVCILTFASAGASYYITFKVGAIHYKNPKYVQYHHSLRMIKEIQA